MSTMALYVVCLPGEPAFGPPAFQADIVERLARGEKPWGN